MVDFTENQSMRTFAVDLWEFIPDISQAMSGCNIDVILEPITQAFEFSGEKIFARISEEYETIVSLYSGLQNDLSQKNFAEAGE